MEFQSESVQATRGVFGRGPQGPTFTIEGTGGRVIISFQGRPPAEGQVFQVVSKPGNPDPVVQCYAPAARLINTGASYSMQFVYFHKSGHPMARILYCAQDAAHSYLAGEVEAPFQSVQQKP